MPRSRKKPPAYVFEDNNGNRVEQWHHKGFIAKEIVYYPGAYREERIFEDGQRPRVGESTMKFKNRLIRCHGSGPEPKPIEGGTSAKPGKGPAVHTSVVPGQPARKDFDPLLGRSFSSKKEREAFMARNNLVEYTKGESSFAPSEAQRPRRPKGVNTHAGTIMMAACDPDTAERHAPQPYSPQHALDSDQRHAILMGNENDARSAMRQQTLRDNLPPGAIPLEDLVAHRTVKNEHEEAARDAEVKRIRENKASWVGSRKQKQRIADTTQRRKKR